MSFRVVAALGCAMSLALTSGAAGAAGERTHDGFFLRMGASLGPLLMRTDVDTPGQVGDDEADYRGLTLGTDIAIGDTPLTGLVLGGTLLAATTPLPTYDSELQGEMDEPYPLGLTAGAIFAQYYFDPTGGLYAQALAGLGAVLFLSDQGVSGGNDPAGAVLGLGGGYDVWLGSEWSFGPFARVLYATVGTEAAGAVLEADYLYPSAGVAVTLH